MGSGLATAASVLAQASQSPNGGDLVAVLVALVFVLIALGIAILLLFLLYKAQAAVPVEHQKITPASVFMLLIPFYNLYWMFVAYQKIPESYQSYFNSRGRVDVGDCGKQIGLWIAICTIAGIIPFVGVLASLASLILIIIYLVKLYGLKAQIQQMGGGGGFPVMPGAVPPQYPPTL